MRAWYRIGTHAHASTRAHSSYVSSLSCTCVYFVQTMPTVGLRWWVRYGTHISTCHEWRDHPSSHHPHLRPWHGYRGGLASASDFGNAVGWPPDVAAANLARPCHVGLASWRPASSGKRTHGIGSSNAHKTHMRRAQTSVIARQARSTPWQAIAFAPQQATARLGAIQQHALRTTRLRIPHIRCL